MIKVIGKARITFQSHALWRAWIVDHTRRIHSAVGHTPAAAYHNLKDRMERDGYELVAPQHATESKGGKFGISPTMMRRSIDQFNANERARFFLDMMVGADQLERARTEVVRAMTEAVKTGTGVVRYDPPFVDAYTQREDHVLPLDEVRPIDRAVPHAHAVSQLRQRDAAMGWDARSYGADGTRWS